MYARTTQDEMTHTALILRTYVEVVVYDYNIRHHGTKKFKFSRHTTEKRALNEFCIFAK